MLQQSDASKFSDARIISDIPFKILVTRYIEEIGEEDKFGKNRQATLQSLRKYLGDVLTSKLTSDRIMEFVRDRIGMGAGGVTIAIDPTYLKQVLDTAKYLWKLPVNPEAVSEAQILMQYAGINTRSKERNRRPTEEELNKLFKHFDEPKNKKTLHYRDIIKFAIVSAMRLGEITRIQ